MLCYRFPEVEQVDQLASERDYKNRDVITVSPEKMGDVYEEKVKMFFHEHIHEDEEIRYCMDGNGFFDVRSEDDNWVRIQLEKDDLIVGHLACIPPALSNPLVSRSYQRVYITASQPIRRT